MGSGFRCSHFADHVYRLTSQESVDVLKGRLVDPFDCLDAVKRNVWSEDDGRAANQIGVVHEGPQLGDSVWTHNAGFLLRFGGADVFNDPLGRNRGPLLNHDTFGWGETERLGHNSETPHVCSNSIARNVGLFVP